jgi:hypothetical protein
MTFWTVSLWLIDKVSLRELVPNPRNLKTFQDEIL